MYKQMISSSTYYTGSFCAIASNGHQLAENVLVFGNPVIFSQLKTVVCYKNFRYFPF